MVLIGIEDVNALANDELIYLVENKFFLWKLIVKKTIWLVYVKKGIALERKGS